VNRAPRSGRATRPSLRSLRSVPALAAACLLATAVGAAARPLLQPATVVPTVKILTRPQPYSHSATARFSWKKGNASTTSCRVDAHKYAPCTTHVTYTALVAGKHTFSVKVTHGAKAKVASATWTIDLTKPTAPVVSGGSASWVTVPPTLQAGSSTDVGSGVASYQYRISSSPGTWGETTAGASVTISQSGVYTVEFRALDKAGNASPWSADATVMLDDDPPSLPTLSGGGSAWQNKAQVVVAASGSVDALNAVAGYRYRTSTDGGSTWSPTWTSGSTATVSAQGSTLVQFEAGDTLGNWSAPRQTAVNIDRSPPTTPVLAGGTWSSWSNAASVNVTASGSTDSPGSGVAHYQYQTQLNGTTSPVQSGSSVTVAGEGKTTVTFWAVDVSGLVSNPVSVQVWLDRTAPAPPTTVSGGSASVWQSVPSVSFSASGATDPGGSGVAGYQYQTSPDGSTWSTPGAGGTLAITGEGKTFVRFRAVDVAGNPSSWVQAGSPAMIDRTAPTAPVLTNASGAWVRSASVTVTASGSTDSPGSGLAHYEYTTQLAGGPVSAQQSGSSVSVSAEGKTTVTFWAVDNAGHTSSPTSGQVWIDRTAPTIPSISGGTMAQWLNTPSVTINGSGSTDPTAANGSPGSGVAGYQYRTMPNSSVVWNSPVSQASVTITAEGWTYVEFRAVDAAGNTSAWSDSGPGSLGAAWALIDRTPPTTPKVTGGSTTCKSGTITLSGSSTDSVSSVASYSYRTSTNGGATWSAPTTGIFTAQFTQQGRWVVQFQAVDQAGNTSNWAPASPTSASTVCHT
jgi:large repetitive protein